MIPEAVFPEFPAKTLRKLTVSGRNPPENARNPVQGSGDRIQLPVMTGSGSGGNRINPVTGSVHRNTASMKSPEIPGSCGFVGEFFDLGIYVQLKQSFHYFSDRITNMNSTLRTHMLSLV